MVNWIGDVRGTQIGNAFLDENEGGRGELRVALNNGAVSVWTTLREGAQLQLNAATDENISVTGIIDVDFQSESGFSGTWQLSDGNKGVVNFVTAPSAQNPPTQLPEQHAQLWNKTIPLGAITLYRADLERLIAEIESHIPQPLQTSIRATENGQVIAMPAKQYLARKEFVDQVNDIALLTEEVVSQGLKKQISVIMNNDGSSNVVAVSPDELWTSAVCSRVEGFLNQFGDRFSSLFRKYGLNVNSVVPPVMV